MSTKSSFTRVFMLVSIICSMLVPLLSTPSSFAQAPQPALPNQRPTQPSAGMPISFLPFNQRSLPHVKYQTHAFGGQVFFATDEVVLALPNPSDEVFKKGTNQEKSLRDLVIEAGDQPNKPVMPMKPIRMQFVQNNPATVITATKQADLRLNRLIGNDRTKWQTNVAVAETITYQHLYSGIDLEYTGANGQMKRTFKVAPHANPNVIEWRYKGHVDVQVDAGGNLVVVVAQKPKATKIATDTAHLLVESAPVAWQIINGEQRYVDIAFNILKNKSVGFTFGTYDPNYELIIDPTISYSTYLGGNGNDWAWDVAIDAQGSSYVTGFTTSYDFPTANSSVTANGEDVFVTKYTPTGDAIVFTTLLGGSSADRGQAIELDTQGNIWITGSTYSTDSPFGYTGYQTTLGGNKDAFVTRLSSDGVSVLYTSLLGGSGADHAHDLAVDTNNNVYIHGYTNSSDFPTFGAMQATFQGGSEAFVAKFMAGATGYGSLVYSTYLGGSGDEWGYGIDVDSAGNAYLTGFTLSADFPVSAGQASYAGNRDAYVVRLNDSGSIAFSTYLGGSGWDEGINIAVDTDGSYYVVGATYSTNFPTINASQSSLAGGMDGWFAKFEGDNRVTTTYFGGNGDDKIADLAIDANHDISVTGATQSSSLPSGMLPYGSLQSTHYGVDAFIAQFGLDRFGSSINNHYYVLYSSYFSGYGDDWGQGIAVAGANIYLVGGTSSTDFPVSNAVQAWLSSGSDAFIARISLDDDQIVNPGQPIQAGIEPATDIDTFYVDLEAGKEIIIRMDRVNEATGLNGYLTLLDPSGRAVASDNDTGRNGNAKINRFIVPVSGRYQIQAKDYAGTRTGPYTLTVSVGNPITPPPPAPPAGQDVDPCPAPTTPTSLPTEDPVTRGPENADFEQGMTELPRTTYPVNCDFAQPAQVLPTTITPAILSYAGGTNAIRTTDSFAVPANAQTLRFKFRIGNRDNGLEERDLTVKVIGTTTTTTIVRSPYYPWRAMTLNGGWQDGIVDIQAFQGQTVRVEFSMGSGTNNQYDIKEQRLMVEVPNWTSNYAPSIQTVNNDNQGHNQHLLIQHIPYPQNMIGNVFVTSSPVIVPNEAQSVRVEYISGDTKDLINSTDAEFLVVSGAIVTRTGTLRGSRAEGWKTGIFDIRQYRGRTVQLRFKANNYLRLDSIRFAIETPYWDVKPEIGINPPSFNVQITNESTDQLITETTILNSDFSQLPAIDTATIVNPEQVTVFSTLPNMSWSGNSSPLTSDFLVPNDADILLFDRMTTPNATEGLTAIIWSGESFSIKTTYGGNASGLSSGTPAGLRHDQVDLTPFRGQRIKLQFSSGGTTTQLTNLRVARLLTGWTREGNNRDKILFVQDSATTGHVALHNEASILSEPFYIDDSMSDIRLRYMSDEAGKGFTAQVTHETTLYEYNGLTGLAATANTWQVSEIDVQRFRGQTIQLRLQGNVGYGKFLHIDDVILQSRIPAWEFYNKKRIKTFQINTSTPTNPFLTLDKDPSELWVQTNAFRVVSTTLQFQYKVGVIGNPTADAYLNVEVYSGANFADKVSLTGTSTTQIKSQSQVTTWTTKNIDLSAFAGRVIKLRFSGTHHTELDSVKLIPGLAGTPKASASAPQGNYIELVGTNKFAQSAYFTVPNDAQYLNFMYQTGWRSRNIGDITQPGNDTDLLVMLDIVGGQQDKEIGRVGGRLIHGWKRGQIDIQAYRGQQVRVRFKNGVMGDPVARIDQISLLTPRGSFSGSQLLAGTTYMNMPMTQFGGTTTPANVTITSLNVYDEYTDLAGTVAYNNQTYNFSLFGNIYHSFFDSPQNKVGYLLDATGNFTVLSFAVRTQTGLLSAMDTTISEPVWSLYLQRKGTREVILIEAPTNTSIPILNTMLTVSGQYSKHYINDYWFDRLFTPTVSSDSGYSILRNSDPEPEGIDYLDHTYVYSKNFDRVVNRKCLIRENIKFSITVFGASMTTNPQATFGSAVSYISESTTLIDSTEGGLIDPCYKTNDANASSLAIGGDPQVPVIVIPFIGSFGDGTEAFQKAIHDATGYKRFTASGSPLQLYLNYELVSGPVTLNLARTLVNEDHGHVVGVDDHSEHTLTHLDPSTNLPKPGYKTMILRHEFNSAYLDISYGQFQTSEIITHWKGKSHTGQVGFHWVIPVTQGKDARLPDYDGMVYNLTGVVYRYYQSSGCGSTATVNTTCS